MGGNALKNCYTRRYSSNEYHNLKRQVLTKLIHKNSFVILAKVIPVYRNKESFGDMDILYSTIDNNPLTIEDVKHAFPFTKEIVRNTDCISFEHNELQQYLLFNFL